MSAALLALPKAKLLVYSCNFSITHEEHSLFTAYQCPKCHNSLELDPASKKFYRCCNKHTYDVAKEGYVNLHLVEKKKSKSPGDDAEMVKSRQRFLTKGYYHCLVHGLQTVFEELCSKKGEKVPSSLLDIGCGEGYYLEALSATLNSWSMVGLDLSKAAVRFAAKRKFGGTLAVASAFELPYASGTFDYALSIFSPVCAEQAARVLKDHGFLIMVGPGAMHLQGLASCIYDRSVEHQGNFKALCEDARFKLVGSHSIESSLTVRGGDIFDLLRMTPYYWHATPSQQKTLSSMVELETPVHFEIQIYKKQPSV